MFDILIRGGRIVDGSGNNWYYGDVGIREDRIAAIGHLKGAEARRVIEAQGLVVSPGFVDIHTHSDLAEFTQPEAKPKIMQGVTTEVVGNCGFSLVPTSDSTWRSFYKQLHFIMGDIPKRWRTLAEYYDDLARQGTSVNVASYIGHGALRAAVMGFENRPPSPDEMAQMKKLLAQGLEEGAMGMSTGLIFTPSSFSTTDELVELCEVLAEQGGIYVSHIRGERDTLFQAVEEIIEIGQRSGAPVHMSHIEAVDRPNWGKAEQEIQMMEAARARGIDISYDMFPYRGSPIRVFSMIPAWAGKGSLDDVRRRFMDPSIRAAIVEQARPQDWEDIVVTKFAGQQGEAWRGRTIAQIAREEGKGPWDLVFDLFIADTSLIITQLHMLSESDVRMAMRHPLGMIISDGTYDPEALRHPRLYSAFAEVLGKYVREEGVLRLEEAVRKITSAPAQRVGLRDIGLIREGMAADITIFDIEAIRSRSTYFDPEQYPVGIEYVLVSGQITMEKGEHTGIRAGRILRRCPEPSG
jgi:N-acyl-D-amino-acid deacylase